MKKCPFCAEEVQDDAKVCRFCNRSLVPPRYGRSDLIKLFTAIGGLVLLFLFLAKFAGVLGPSSTGPKNAPRRSQSDPVSIVKNGMLEVDQSTTVGNAFDHYRYFDSVDWKAFQTENARIVVHASGAITLDKLKPSEVGRLVLKSIPNMGSAAEVADAEKMLEKARKHIQSIQILAEFLLDQEGGFSLRTTSIHAVRADGTASPELNQTEEDLAKLLKDIYDNELPEIVASVVIAGSVAK